MNNEQFAENTGIPKSLAKKMLDMLYAKDFDSKNLDEIPVHKRQDILENMITTYEKLNKTPWYFPESDSKYSAIGL